MTLFLLFARAFPIIAIAEVKSIFSISSAEARKRELKKNADFEANYEGSFGTKYADDKVNDTNHI
jgi:hypothetical protein